MQLDVLFLECNNASRLIHNDPQQNQSLVQFFPDEFAKEMNSFQYFFAERPIIYSL